MSYEDYVHKGGWINWSHDTAFGNTLTLSSRGGYFLVAFLSLYVTIAGNRFWLIIAFLIHQEKATRNQFDGVHFQQQVILRNDSTPMGAFMSFLKVARRWKGIAEKPILRSLPLLLLTLLIQGAFHAASLLTAEVTKAAGNETLIHSPNCAYWTAASNNPFEQGGLRTKLAADTVSAASYSRACYGKNSSLCTTYAAKQIDWEPVANPTCPFSPELCFSSPSAVYQMDTGQIDSHYILGLNAPKKNRITYRRLTTCAPINATKFLSKGSDSAGNTWFNYSMGAVPGISTGDVTYGYNTRTIQDHISYQISYVLNPLALTPSMCLLLIYNHRSYSPDVSVTWVPDIQHIDADITVFFLTANSLLYTHANNDLIFGATTKVNLVENNLVNVSYRADNPVAVLGCADQHQWCSAPSKCSSLSGLVLPSDTELQFNPQQHVTAVRIYNSMLYNDMYFAVDPRGAAALQASESVYETSQSAVLPDTQWISEVQGWFNVSLAKLQQTLIDVAVGPSPRYPDITYSGPINKLNSDLCKAQIVRSTGQYQNFSVLGIALTLTISTVFIGLSFVLDKSIGLVQRLIGRGEARRMQWLLDDKLHLQRVAYVGAGGGEWDGNPAEIPTTQERELKPLLDLPGNEKAREMVHSSKNDQ